MCWAEAIMRGDLVLKWCYDCRNYRWCQHEEGRFVCTSCGFETG